MTLPPLMIILPLCLALGTAAAEDLPGLPPTGEPGGSGAKLLPPPPPECDKTTLCRPDPRVPMLDGQGNPVLKDGKPQYFPSGDEKGDMNCVRRGQKRMVIAIPDARHGKIPDAVDQCGWVQTVIHPGNYSYGGSCGPALPTDCPDDKSP